MLKKIIYSATFLWLSWMAVCNVGTSINQSLTVSHDYGIRWLNMKIMSAGENPFKMETYFDMDSGQWRRDTHNFLSPYAKSLLDSDGRIRFDNCYLPSTSLILIPFATLDFGTSCGIYELVNLACGVGFLWFCWQYVKKESSLSLPLYVLGCLMFWASLPWNQIIFLGNYPMVAMTLFMAALYYSDKGWSLLAGLLLAFSMFKYQLVLPFAVIFLMQKRWVELGFCAAYHLIFHFIMCWWIQTSPLFIWRDTFEIAKVTMSYKGLAVDSVVAVFKGWKHTDPYFEVSGLAALFFGLLIFGKKFKRHIVALFSLVTLVCLMITYHRSYDHLIFLFPLFWAFGLEKSWVTKAATFLMVVNFFFIRQSFWGQICMDHWHYSFRIYDFVKLNAVIFYPLAAVLLYKHFQQYKSWRSE